MNMKLKIKYIVPLFFLFIAKAESQQLSAGIYGGYTTGAVKISEIKNQFADVIKGDNIWGIEAGLYAKGAFGPFYIKPLALLQFKNGTVDIMKDETQVENSSYSEQKLNVPLMFGLNVIGPLSIEAGPVYNYIFHATHEFNSNGFEFNKNGLGYRFGAVAEISRLNFAVYYQGIKNSSSSTMSSFEVPHEMIFSLGIRLGKM